MKTQFMLLAEYEAPIIPLHDISEKYFGIAKHTASDRAKKGTLPIPAFKLGKSQKHPWFIHLNDLAKLIDEQVKEANKEHVG